MPTVAAIYRYPVKGLSPQPLSAIAMQAGRPFPFDRVYALARPGSAAARTQQWSKKGNFVMLMFDEALARFQTSLDVTSLDFNVSSGNETLLSANLATSSGREEVETFYRNAVSGLKEAPRLVKSDDGHFMDKPDNVVSLINLETVRSLERQWNVKIDPLRFRANFYIDGVEPWQEFNWIGKTIKLGDVSFAVDRRNGRCGATNVNPANGERDLDIPGSLRTAFGHKDLGVYLVVKHDGTVSLGDSAKVPVGEAVVASAAAASGSEGRYMCRGCYFIYDQAAGVAVSGVAPGTAFADIDASWLCPDCGGPKGYFQAVAARS